MQYGLLQTAISSLNSDLGQQAFSEGADAQY